MIHLVNSICIEAKMNDVWNALSDIEKVSIWVPPIIEAKCPTDKTRGIGAERHCRLKGHINIQEKWIAWEEGRSFSYVASGMPLVKSAFNSWTLKEEKRMTLVVSEAEIDFGDGIAAKLLGYLMTPSMKRLGPQSLASFKYWVENGEAFKGKMSALPLGPALC